MLIDMNLPTFDIYQGTKSQSLDVLIFFKKTFCLMSGLKYTLSDATCLLPENLSGLKNIYIQI